MEESRRPEGGNSTYSRTRTQGLAPSLRILCLHDNGSNAGELSDQLEELGERLYEKHMIDLVYVNAPLLVSHDDDNDDQRNHALTEPKRVWWEEGIDPENPDKPKQFLGLDATLLLLRQVWNSMPFWGILAVGESAAAAAFLPLLPVTTPPCCMITFYGKSILEEDDCLLVDNQLACLHLLPQNPSPASERLVRQIGGKARLGVSPKLSHSFNAMGQVRSSGLDSKSVVVVGLCLLHCWIGLYAVLGGAEKDAANDQPGGRQYLGLAKSLVPGRTRGGYCCGPPDRPGSSQSFNGRHFTTSRRRMERGIPTTGSE